MNIDRFLFILNKKKELFGEEELFVEEFIKKNKEFGVYYIDSKHGEKVRDREGYEIFSISDMSDRMVRPHYYDLVDIVRQIVEYEEEEGVRFNL